MSRILVTSFVLHAFFVGILSQRGGNMGGGDMRGMGRMGGMETPSQLSPMEREQELALRKLSARNVLKYMDEAVDPCTDFYSFACGNWATSMNIPADETSSAQNQIEQRINAAIQQILTETSHQQEPTYVRKVKEFYRDCTNVPAISTEQFNFMKNLLRSIGGMPGVSNIGWNPNAYNWVFALGSLRARLNLEILIGLDIDTNIQTGSGNSLYLTEPKTTIIPAELCNSVEADEQDIKDQVYEDLQREVASNMMSWLKLNEEEANRFASEVVQFELSLCKGMGNDGILPLPAEEDEANNMQQQGRRLSNPNAYNNKNSNQPYVRTGQDRLHGRSLTSNKYRSQSLHQWNIEYKNAIDFKQFMNISFQYPINEPVYMRSERYFRHLGTLLRRTPTPTRANYIAYQTLKAMNMPRDARRNERNNYCVELILRYMPKLIGEMYFRKYYRDDMKSTVDVMYNQHIKRAFEVSLEQADWMDSRTRSAAQQKSKRITIETPSYQNTLTDDLMTERLLYWEKLAVIMQYSARQFKERLNANQKFNILESFTVDAKLAQRQNQIVMGLGLLQKPLYNPLYANSLKFSGLGQRLARALVSGFDEVGFNNDPINAQLSEWSAVGLRNITECFRAQYSNYLYDDPVVFRDADKLHELIADSNGLNIVFNAYLSWLESVDPQAKGLLMRETLPDVNYSNTQLFFINFAQTRCAGRPNEQPPPPFLRMEQHTPERFDVVGPLANSIEFAREFGCAIGTEMNPADKCVIYDKTDK